MREIKIEAAAAADGRLLDALADEMVALTGRLASLAYDLASEPETLRRHMETLQAVDLITQTQLALADMLRSSASIDDRIASVTLADLADRMRERLAHVSDTHPDVAIS